VAFDLLRAVDADGAYANLALPRLISEAGLGARNAALATELGYGTLRAAGTLDAIIDACTDRPAIDAPVRDLLRLGSYQLLRTRVPPHAAVATTVELTRATGNGRASGFVNAVLRRVTESDWTAWTDRLSAGRPALEQLALQTAHPIWIARAFADALGGDLAETASALVADDERPITHLVALPGRIDRDELIAQSGGLPGPYSPFAVQLSAGGDPARLPAIRGELAMVQDEGSQLCALALARAPLTGRDERWLDLCAGPGGKAALLAAIATERGARLDAHELHPHRADLVRRATAPWDVQVTVGDARDLVAGGATDGGYDRILLDAPCTGLGALRRRPEARWRRTEADVVDLARLQGELLDAALRLVRPGGVIAYVTCSPHLTETQAVVAGRSLRDARELFGAMPQLGDGPTVQLWPHRHGTDAMFLALLEG
jgi:16S rRNA (cytosine967-C5)-methyltransferase